MIADIGLIVGIGVFVRIALLARPQTPGRWVTPPELLLVALALVLVALLTADILMQGLAGVAELPPLPQSFPRR